MDKETLSALELSISHWERMANGTQEAWEIPHGSCCALCKMFADKDLKSDTCGDCPVALETGKNQCDDTPFYKARTAYEVSGINSIVFRACAKSELKFLQSLLPKTEDSK